MTYKNDERIMELKRVIEDKRKELASKPTRFIPITNCLLVLDGVSYNLHIDTNELLLVKLNTMKMSAMDLGIDTNTLVISGSRLNDWVTDVKNNLEFKKYKEEKKKLNILEKQLTDLLSSDKQTELKIDEIEKMI